MSRNSGENLVERICILVNAFMTESPKLTLIQLSSITGIHAATVYRIAEALVKEGVLNKDPDTKMYSLGIRMIEMGEYAKNNFSINEISKKHVQKLAALWQERVVVDILDSNFHLLTVQYCNLIFPNMTIASYQVPVLPHCTSTGKILLAHTSEEILNDYINTRFIPKTEKTITSVDMLLQELDSIRKQGYAMSIEEFEKGYQSVGAPIKNSMEQVTAAISIRWPLFRNYGELLQTIIETVKKTAYDISSDLKI